MKKMYVCVARAVAVVETRNQGQPWPMERKAATATNTRRPAFSLGSGLVLFYTHTHNVLDYLFQIQTNIRV